ncbi:MAG: DUF2807 domain-containing protein [Spirochaetes bacterium]|nr:DUF2807 domain-containing protein [Spirochaetota bacterium]MBU1080975.1 DUF2807 domain-containing protein [Spirochaetota bacterium]
MIRTIKSAAGAAATLCLAIASMSCLLVPELGNGVMETETRTLDRAFDSISLSGVIDMEFVQAKESKVTITVDENLLEFIETDIVSGELQIDQRPFTSIWPSRGSKIIVYGPSVLAVSASGTGSVGGSGLGLAGRDFELSLSGTGECALGVEAARLTLRSSGTGSCTLDGAADTLVIRSSGTGSVKAEGLLARNVELYSSGTGSVYVRADGSVSGSMSGTGSLYCYGKPTVTVSKSGTGSIKIF